MINSAALVRDVRAGIRCHELTLGVRDREGPEGRDKVSSTNPGGKRQGSGSEGDGNPMRRNVM